MAGMENSGIMVEKKSSSFSKAQKGVSMQPSKSTLKCTLKEKWVCLCKILHTSAHRNIIYNDL